MQVTNLEEVKISIPKAAKKLFNAGIKYGVVHLGFSHLDYLRYAIENVGWECTAITGIKGTAKSCLLLQSGYAIYQDWDIVLEYMPIKPIEFGEIINQKGRIPWIGWDDIATHLPRTLYFTDRETWDELSKNWETYRTKMSNFECTATRKSKIVGFILEDLTADIKCFKREKDIKSHYEYWRWLWLDDPHDPTKENAFRINIEEIPFPLTPEALNYDPEFKQEFIIGGIPKHGKEFYNEVGLNGVPRNIFKRYWKRRTELADEAAKKTLEIFKKKLGEKSNEFIELVKRAMEIHEELRDEDGKLNVAKIRLKLGVGRNLAYDIKKAIESFE